MTIAVEVLQSEPPMLATAPEACEACGGSGVHRISDGRWTRLDLERECLTCGGTGEEPAASAALLVALQDAAQVAGLDAAALRALCVSRFGYIPARPSEGQVLRLLAAIEALR